jgi:2,3-bisphosphoglycerate-independent phosphoglycerate mutase
VLIKLIESIESEARIYKEMGSAGQNAWKLADHPKLPKGKTIAMVVLDGWGEAKPDQYNCIHVADTPTMDSFKTVLFFLFFFVVVNNVI